MLKPPETVLMVMEALCILNSIPPTMVADPQNPRLKIPSYWESGKKFLADKHFIKTLLNFNKDSIPPQLIRKVRDTYI